MPLLDNGEMDVTKYYILKNVFKLTDNCAKTQKSIQPRRLFCHFYYSGGHKEIRSGEVRIESKEKS